MKDNTAAVHVQVPVEVTSFLLNEKRTEITKIELKQRVTVLLVPNKHLDTPNYKLERLRQDDPRLEGLQASYTMIEEPSDEVGITRRDKSGKAKQEPVIKGVLPDQPAPPPPAPPVRAPVATEAVAAVALPAAAPAAAGLGFFGWVKRLFATPTATSPTVAVAAEHPVPAKPEAGRGDGRRGERGERGGRGGRGGRDGGRGEGRESREARPARDQAHRGRVDPPAEAGTGRTDSAEANGRGARGDRHDHRRTGRAEAEATRPQATPEAGGEAASPGQIDDRPGETGAGERDGQRRRRRGGRGGRDRDELRTDALPTEVATDGPLEVQAFAESLPPPSATAVADADRAEGARPDAVEGERERGRRRGGRGRDRSRRDAAPGDSVESADQTASESGVPQSEVVASSVAAPDLPRPTDFGLSEPAAAVLTMPEQSALDPDPAVTPTAVVPPNPPAPAAAPHFELPIGDLQALAASAGLEWVNSDAQRIQVVREAMAHEPKPARVPRAPRPRVVLDDGPLVLVETRKDLSQLKLPFDNAAAAAQAPPQ